MFQATTLDDAGQRVPLVRFNLMLLPFSTGPLPPELQRAIRSAVMAENWKAKHFLSRQAMLRSWIGVVPPAIMFGSYKLMAFTGLFHGLGRLGPEGWLLTLLGIPLVFLFMFFVMAKIIPHGLTDHARKLCTDMAVFSGHCGSCGYILPETPNTDNGLCRCPECGAAWARSKSVPQDR